MPVFNVGTKAKASSNWKVKGSVQDFLLVDKEAELPLEGFSDKSPGKEPK